jgi:hypothetical protein
MVMNRLLSIAAMVTVLTVIATAVAAQAPRVITDPEHRFTISVPSGWNVQTSNGYRAPAVSAKSPAAAGQLPDSVDVITQDLPTAISPQGCAGEAAQVMRFTIHNWTTLHEGSATFAGLPAYSRWYTWRAPTGQDRRSVQTCVTLGRRAFMVIGTTANSQSALTQQLPRLQQIMATFKPNTTHLPSAEPPAGVPHSGSGTK